MRRVQRRSSIERARNLTFQVKHYLNLFDKELKDIGRRLEMQIDTSSFANFSDFFFNNIITDWILNQQLVTAIGAADNARNYVNEMLIDLQAELNEVLTNISDSRQNREEILLG